MLYVSVSILSLKVCKEPCFSKNKHLKISAKGLGIYLQAIEMIMKIIFYS